MPDVVYISACIMIGVLLLIGAYTDYKSRIIPNAIPIGILICGCFTATPWWYKLFSFILMVLFLIIFSKKKSGGGDIKLYCALSFALGLFDVAIVLTITLALSFILTLIKKRKIDKTARIPLCTFVAPAYILYLGITAFL